MSLIIKQIRYKRIRCKKNYIPIDYKRWHNNRSKWTYAWICKKFKVCRNV